MPFPLRCPGNRFVTLQSAEDHPILGAVEQILVDDNPVAKISKVDWSNPQSIPAIDRPGSLPPGIGTFLLNELATNATTPLKYTGPYPTLGLFHSLTTSFTPSVSGEEGGKLFSKDYWECAPQGVSVIPDVDFTPQPFEPEWFDGGCLLTRAGNTIRTYLGDIAYGSNRQLFLAPCFEKTELGIRLDIFASGKLVKHVGIVHGAQPKLAASVQASKPRTKIPDALASRVITIALAQFPEEERKDLADNLGELFWDELGGKVFDVHDKGISLNRLLLSAYKETPANLLQGLVQILATTSSTFLANKISNQLEHKS